MHFCWRRWENCGRRGPLSNWVCCWLHLRCRLCSAGSGYVNCSWMRLSVGILILAWLYGAGLIYVVFICVSIHFGNICFLPAYKMFHQLHMKDRHSGSRKMYHILSSRLHALGNSYAFTSWMCFIVLLFVGLFSFTKASFYTFVVMSETFCLSLNWLMWNSKVSR